MPVRMQCFTYALHTGHHTFSAMKRTTILLSSILLFHFTVVAQNFFRAKVMSGVTGETLKGATATIPDLKLNASADSSGMLFIMGIPNGKFQVMVSFTGYGKSEKVYVFPMQHPNDTLVVTLEPESGELAEVTVQTTRTNQNIRDIPTRIEALPLEELDEKSTMRPGDIKMLLGETTGIHVQQSSAVSDNASFRIQGLDSRYTQLLQDGMPLYAGFSGNLSLLQVSPLSLRQVEFIKGSASTLYGGGAIAGLVNLISKTPTKTPELNFLLNGTSAKGVDASGYYSQKWNHIGTTMFGSFNHSDSYDPSNIGFSAIPKTDRFSLAPKVFFNIDEHNSGWFGVNTVYENRLGGDMRVIAGNADSVHQYFERNKTFRFSTQLSFTRKIDEESRINFKNSIGYFNRQLTSKAFGFYGKQLSSFSEVNYVKNGAISNWVAGANLTTDHLSVQPLGNIFDYNLTTLGGFVQNTFKATDWLTIESGLRLDYNTPTPSIPSNGVFLLPRVNALFKLDKHFTSRIGGGFGYKMPNIFNDQSEQYGYQNLKPLAVGNTPTEKSYGANADLNYRGKLGDEATININQLLFYTYVDRPLILEDSTLVSSKGHLITRGAETNIKLVIDELVFYLGYTFTDTRQHINGLSTTQPLTPKHQLNLDITYEIENSFRFGAESFYNSSQLLGDGTTGKGFVTFGLLVQKMWKHLDVFINFENLTDRRQTRWGNIYTGSIADPVFKDIYAPLDGRLINMGVRIKLLK